MTRAPVPAIAPRDATGFARCPLCHTDDRSTTASDLNAGATWRCALCHQQWDARRLATVTAYAAWVARRSGSHTPSPRT
jgi:hypothetical protein